MGRDREGETKIETETEKLTHSLAHSLTHSRSLGCFLGINRAVTTTAPWKRSGNASSWTVTTRSAFPFTSF